MANLISNTRTPISQLPLPEQLQINKTKLICTIALAVLVALGAVACTAMNGGAFYKYGLIGVLSLGALGLAIRAGFVFKERCHLQAQ
jgi:hypothetical protein